MLAPYHLGVYDKVLIIFLGIHGVFHCHHDLVQLFALPMIHGMRLGLCLFFTIVGFCRWKHLYTNLRIHYNAYYKRGFEIVVSKCSFL